MIIKVCGMREPDNIHAVMSLGVDMIGFMFCPKSKRYVSQISSNAGMIPDSAGIKVRDSDFAHSSRLTPKRVGVFVDDMPQNIVTRVYNYRLDYVQLNGDEGVTYIDNIRRTLVPDIAPDIKFIKSLLITDVSDIKRWMEFHGHVDMLLFRMKGRNMDGKASRPDWSVLESYDGDIPFMIGGDILPDDVEMVNSFRHTMFAGIDLNVGFEDAPALKNIDKLKAFVGSTRDR